MVWIKHNFKLLIYTQYVDRGIYFFHFHFLALWATDGGSFQPNLLFCGSGFNSRSTRCFTEKLQDNQMVIYVARETQADYTKLTVDNLDIRMPLHHYANPKPGTHTIRKNTRGFYFFYFCIQINSKFSNGNGFDSIQRFQCLRISLFRKISFQEIIAWNFYYCLCGFTNTRALSAFGLNKKY